MMTHNGFLLLALLSLSLAACGQARTLNRDAASGKTEYGTLRRLLASGSDSCTDIMNNIDLPSGNTLNDGSKDITTSSADCCKLCNDNPDCKSWTRIKFDVTYNKAGECWLRDHTPQAKSCSHCESGVAKSVDDILDACVEDGQKAAKIAVVGACSVLTRKCPVSRSASRTPAFGAAVLPKLIPAVTERTCDILFEDACIRSGFDEALIRGDDCTKILTNGPDITANVPECPDFTTASSIFESTLEEACVE